MVLNSEIHHSHIAFLAIIFEEWEQLCVTDITDWVAKLDVEGDLGLLISDIIQQVFEWDDTCLIEFEIWNFIIINFFLVVSWIIEGINVVKERRGVGRWVCQAFHNVIEKPHIRIACLNPQESNLSKQICRCETYRN